MKKILGLISNIVIILCVIIFAFAAWKLWGYFSQYNDGKKEYSSLRKYVHEGEEDQEEHKEETKAGQDVCPVKVDFDQLSRINEDIVGWIYIEGSPINFPIVQTSVEEEGYYLKRTFEKEKNFGGSIFMDSLCEADFSSDNSIIYGHNLKNGEMFGSLKKMYDTNYNEKADYSKYPVIWILTPDEIKEYEVFCAREISASKNNDVYMVEFSLEEELEDYIKQMKKNSLFQTSVDTSNAEAVLTLSTCTSDTEDGRFIVQGILKQTTAQD